MTKKIGVILFLSLLVLFLGFSQSALVERYLTAANNSYSQKDYAKAFDYINYVYGTYTSENVPQNVEILAETIYYDYLQEIREKKDTDAFAKVKEKLLEYAEEIRRQLSEAEKNDYPALKRKYLSLYKTRFETIGFLSEQYIQAEGRTDIESVMSQE